MILTVNIEIKVEMPQKQHFTSKEWTATPAVHSSYLQPSMSIIFLWM